MNESKVCNLLLLVDFRIATDCRLDLAATTNYFWYVDVNSELITASLEARQATQKQLGFHENTL